MEKVRKWFRRHWCKIMHYGRGQAFFVYTYRGEDNRKYRYMWCLKCGEENPAIFYET